jgi:hypothetical protein
MNCDTTLSWHTFGSPTRGRLDRGPAPPGGPADILRLDGITGDAGWETDPLAVQADAEYVLTWSLKHTGPGGYRLPAPRDDLERREHAYWDRFMIEVGMPQVQPFLWYRFLDFLGVELEWRDAGERALAIRRHPLSAAESCEGVFYDAEQFREFLRHRADFTKGWSPVWLRTQAPAGAAALVIRFRLTSRAEVDAGIALSGLRLSPALQSGPPAPGLCRYVIRAVDPHTGARVPARIAMRDQHGAWFAPDPAFKVRATFGTDLVFCYAPAGEIVVDAPVGKYAIEAVAGLECDVARAQADYVREGATEIIELELARRLPLREAGWHCGDHHLHLSGHATKDYPLMDPRTGMELGQADGQDYFPFQGDYFDYLRRGGEVLTQGRAIGQRSTEICSLVWGHYCCVMVGDPTPLPPAHLALYPSMYDVVQAIHARGGACIAAHPHQMICQPFNTVVTRADQAAAIAAPGRFNCARELPLMHLLGEPCGYDLLIADGAGVQPMATREYYRLLDFGFRVAACGSTDTGINSGNSCYPSCRTYVRSDALTFPAIAAGYRRGHTFATNGPVLLTDVDGQLPGAVHVVREGATVCVKARLFSPWGLSHVEAVCNGRVAARRELGGHNEAEVELPVSVREPGWLAVVARGPGARWVNATGWPEPATREQLGQLAHTTPIYIRFPDRPLRPAAAGADYYRRWMDSLAGLVEHYRSLWPADAARAGIKPEDVRDILLGRIAQARQRIDALARNGWPGEES